MIDYATNIQQHNEKSAYLRTLISDKVFHKTKKNTIRLNSTLKHHVVAPEVTSQLDFTGTTVNSKFIDLKEN